MAEGLAKEWPPPNHGAPPAQVSRLGRRTASMLSFCGSDADLAAAASRLPGSECAWARVGPPRGTIAASPPAVTALVKPGAVLVNVAYGGGVVDEDRNMCLKVSSNRSITPATTTRPT